LEKINMKNIDLILNKTCNLNCFFCNPEKITKDFLWSEKLQILSNIKTFFEKWFESITFSWGEPTLDKNLIIYIKFAQKIGFKNIKLQTNFTLLNREFLELLTLSGLNEIWFTYFGYDETTFLNIVGNSNYFAKYRDNIALIKDSNIRLVSDIVLNDFLIDDLENILNDLEKVGISHINFKYPFNTGKSFLPNKIMEYSEKLRFFLDKKDFPYNILYIPTCFLNWFEDKVYKTEKDYISDWNYLFSLKETLDKNFYKENNCEDCLYKQTCFWLEKWYSLELKPIKNG
jgi:molybdenum cofactor biosynthesis enzyme MoaA